MKCIRKIALIILCVSIILCFTSILNASYVRAEGIKDNINEQINVLDMDELRDFLNNIKTDGIINFGDLLNNLLNGEYNISYQSLYDYVVNILLVKTKDMLPFFLSIVVICFFAVLIRHTRRTGISDSIEQICNYVILCAVLTILILPITNLIVNAKNIIETIAKMSEIISPIILTLMVSVGANVSVAVYKPVMTFLTGGVINIVLYIIFPLIIIMTIFNIISCFASGVSFKKFSDFFSSCIKWVYGITVTIFGVFVSVQGITSASFDGVSIKAAKYAISNSIPIIGGFVKDGFDLVVAGSVIIKQSIGVTSIFALFYILLSPVMHMVIFSLLLKLVCAIVEPISDSRVIDICLTASKTITHLIVALIIVALMFFIIIFLLIISANAFI